MATIFGTNNLSYINKATTNEATAPKLKHLSILLSRVNTKETNLDEIWFPLHEKMQSSYWIVVYKSLITLHTLIQGCNERFLQTITKSKINFSFLHKFSHRDGKQVPFMIQHGNYLETKIRAYKNAGFDYCRLRRGQAGFLRSINLQNIFNHMHHLEGILDKLLAFDAKENHLGSSLVLTSFNRLFTDLVSLVQFYNEALEILIDIYVEADLATTIKISDIYFRYLERISRMKGLFAEAQEVGIENSDFKIFDVCPKNLKSAIEDRIKYLTSESIDFNNSQLNSPQLHKKKISTPEFSHRIDPLKSLKSDLSSTNPPKISIYEQKSCDILKKQKSSPSIAFPVQFENPTIHMSSLNSLPPVMESLQNPNENLSTIKSNPTSPDLYTHNVIKAGSKYSNSKQKSVPNLLGKIDDGIHMDLIDLVDDWRSPQPRRVSRTVIAKNSSCSYFNNNNKPTQEDFDPYAPHNFKICHKQSSNPFEVTSPTDNNNNNNFNNNSNNNNNNNNNNINNNNNNNNDNFGNINSKEFSSTNPFSMIV